MTPARSRPRLGSGSIIPDLFNLRMGFPYLLVMVMAETAAASVLFSLTSMTAFCMTPETRMSLDPVSRVWLRSDLPGMNRINMFEGCKLAKIAASRDNLLIHCQGLSDFDIYNCI